MLTIPPMIATMMILLMSMNEYGHSIERGFHLLMTCSPPPFHWLVDLSIHPSLSHAIYVALRQTMSVCRESNHATDT